MSYQQVALVTPRSWGFYSEAILLHDVIQLNRCLRKLAKTKTAGRRKTSLKTKSPVLRGELDTTDVHYKGHGRRWRGVEIAGLRREAGTGMADGFKTALLAD